MHITIFSNYQEVVTYAARPSAYRLPKCLQAQDASNTKIVNKNATKTADISIKHTPGLNNNHK